MSEEGMRDGIQLQKQIMIRASESPDDAGRCAIVILRGAEIVTAHVIRLNTPGKILERQLVISAPSDVVRDRVINDAAGVDVPDAAQALHKGSPSPHVGRNSKTAEAVVLRDAAAIEAAAIENHPEVPIAGEGNELGGSVPAAIALRVHHVGELAVGDTGVKGSVWNQLCRHRDREGSEGDTCQHRSGNFRHELFLPGNTPAKKRAEINKIC